MIIRFKFLFNIYKNFLQFMYMQRINLSTGTCIFGVGIGNIYQSPFYMHAIHQSVQHAAIEDIYNTSRKDHH